MSFGFCSNPVTVVLYFFDLPVYRLGRDRYYDEREAAINSDVYQVGTPAEAALRERERNDSHAFVSIRDHLQRVYGGPWEFNEVIGYIRLHFLGNQVRGEYFAVSAKRIVRTRRKVLELQTLKLAPEVTIEEPSGTDEVLAAIRQYIVDCRTELPRRFIDTENFEVLAPYVDWGAIYRAPR